jgi:pimeloyl-ACP methyl ester carboxylesterase
MRPQTRYARSGDVRIAYQVTGSGPVDLVWAPGIMSHLDLDWDLPSKARFIERMSSFCRLIRFDKRGTGLSDRPTVAATLEERIDDIRAIMDAAGSARAVILGTSGGTPMACLFAATYPQRTRALIIWGGMARFTRTADYPWGIGHDEMARLIARLADYGASVEYVVGPAGGLGPDVNPELLDWFVRYAHAAVSPSAAAAMERMNAETDVRTILPSISVPTLVMNSTDDPVTHVEAARDLAARIPGAKFVEFPGASHHIFLEDADPVAETIEQFVTGARSSAAAVRQLVTLIVVDVVGSTAQAAAVGDTAWRGLLEDYYALARLHLAAFDGISVDTAGDGLLARFDGPTRAIRCAAAIVESVQRLGLRLRAGVHTGEVELMDGGKIAGIAVHTAARIASEAGPNEVVVSGTVKDLAAGSGIEFQDRGIHSLKGVPGEWRLFTVSNI